MRNYSLKKGFTLAEVLITLGIIGIVAAMTIPTLITNYKDKELVTRAKKTLADITNAVSLARAENSYGNNTILFNTNNTNKQTLDSFAKYFKVQEMCVANSDGCGGKYQYKLVKPMSTNGDTYIGNNFYYLPRFMTIDGIVVAIEQYTSCSHPSTNFVMDDDGNILLDDDNNPVTIVVTANYCAKITVDTNGNAAPNQVGRDVFVLRVLENEIASSPSSWEGNMFEVVKTGKLIDTVDYNIGDSVSKD